MNSTEILRELGLTDEQIIEKIVDRVADSLMLKPTVEDYGDKQFLASEFKKRLDAMIQERINQAVDAAASEFAAPKMKEYLEKFMLQETNKWGEKKGEPVTFTEYLVARADAWMQEVVNHNGKTRAEESFGWTNRSTRIAYLIDEHLRFHIDRAMKEAAKKANESIVGGIKKAVDASLNDLKIEIKGAVK